MAQKVLKIMLPIFVLGIGVFGFRYLAGFKKPPPMKAPPEVVVPVNVVKAIPFTEKVEIQGLGTVIPSREVTLQAEVTGLATAVNPNLIAGGRIAAGDVLVKIDPRDYRLAIKQQAAQVEQAKLRVEEEESRRAVAEKEWALLSPNIKSTSRGKALALREPQVKSAEVNLTAAQGALERARLALERTILKAPMNAVVRAESIEIGQRLGPGSPIATLVGSDQWWVRTTIDRAHLETLSAEGVTVELSQIRDGRGRLTWPAQLDRILPEVEAAGQMVQAIIAVEDPLGMKSRRAPLFLGDTVEVNFQVSAGPNLFAIPRNVMRPGSVLWVADADKKLKVMPVEPVWKDRDRILLRNVDPDVHIISSRLATPTPGVKLKFDGEEEQTSKKLDEVGTTDGDVR